MNFNNMTIVVTGGASGIGRSIAMDLLDANATVHVVDSDKEMLQALRDKLAEAENSKMAYFHFCDISSPESVSTAFMAIREKGGWIYGLANCAGINPSRKDILGTSHSDWEKTLAVNLTGTFNCCKEALPDMLKLGRGSIVNISSIAGITALCERASYMSSKWGLVGLTSSIALDYAKHRVRVNCVCPGYIETPLVKGYLNGLSSDEFRKLKSAHPLGRLGTPNDVSKAVRFLLSDDAEWITGAILPVDGGYRIGK